MPKKYIFESDLFVKEIHLFHRDNCFHLIEFKGNYSCNILLGFSSF